MRARLKDPDAAYRRRWYTLLVLCLSLMVIGLDNTVLNVAIPTLAKPVASGGFKLFHMLIGHLDGANERLALAQAVTIRATGHEQTVFIGDFQIVLRNRSGMFTAAWRSASSSSARVQPSRPRPRRRQYS